MLNNEGRAGSGSQPAETSQVRMTQFLSHQYLCESLTLAEVSTLMKYVTMLTFKEGDVLSDIGDVGDALYFVLEGEIALVYDEGGQEHEIVRAGAGQMLGEMSFFDRQPRSVRLITKTAGAEVLKLSRPMYQRLKVEHPYIAVNIVEHAIISVDNLFRRLSSDYAEFSRYFYRIGK